MSLSTDLDTCHSAPLRSVERGASITVFCNRKVHHMLGQAVALVARLGRGDRGTLREAVATLGSAIEAVAN